VTDGELRVGKGIADFQLDPPDFVENELELLSPSKQQQIHDKLEGMEGPSKPGHGFPYQQRKEPIQSPLCAGRPRRGENDEGRMDGHRRGGDTDEAACFASADRRGRRRVRAHLLRYMGWAAGETVLSVRMNYALGLLCTVCFRVDFLSVFFSFLKPPIRLLRKEKNFNRSNLIFFHRNL